MNSSDSRPDTDSNHTVRGGRQWLNRLPLRLKMLAAFVILALIPLLWLSATNYLAGVAISEQRIGAGLESAAMSNAITIGGFLGGQVDKMQGLALNSGLREGVLEADAVYLGDESEIQAQLLEMDQRWQSVDDADELIQTRLNNDIVEELRRYRDAFPDNLELVVLDKYGAVAAATSRTEALYYADREEWNVVYSEGKGGVFVGVGTPLFNESGSVYGVVVAVPVYAADGEEVIGVLRTTYRLKGVTDLITFADLGQPTTTHVLLPDNRIIMANGLVSERLADDVAGQLRAVGDLEFQRMFYLEDDDLLALRPVIEVKERASIVGEHTIGDLNWYVIVFRNREEALLVVRREMLTGIFMASAVLVLTVGGAALASRILLEPIRSFITTVDRIVAGDVLAQVSVESRDEMGALAEVFNHMTDQHRRLITELEQRVEERTIDLERRSAYLRASAEVGRAATSILDTEALIRQVVELIRQRFDLYYVGLFLVDSTNQWAVLHAGTGEAGQIMLARGHRLPIGESSMIGWSIMNVQARVALEAGGDALRLATAELPDTRSEAALPLLSRGRVLGALTVQSDQPGAFDETSVAMLQLMADQVAVALDNARLFAEGQASLETARRAYGELSRQAWLDMLRTHRTLGYRGDKQGIVRVEGPMTEDMKQAFQTGEPVYAASEASDETIEGKLPLTIPVKVHGQVIAVLDTHKLAAGGKWTPDEVTLLELLAEQLGLALESARLYQDTQRRATRERLAGEVTAHIRESLDLDAVLRTAVEQMRQTLDLEKVTVSLRLREEDQSS